MSKKTLTILSPVYNEEAVIKYFYICLSRVISNIDNSYDINILFVIDKSSDKTLSILKEIAHYDPRVQLISLSSRFGHQMSLLAGIDHCTSDIIIMMDSDLQHPPELIPELLEKYEKGYDIVFTIRQDAPETGWFKKTTSHLFYVIINWMSDIPISNSSADFRLISQDVAQIFQTQIRERNQFMRGLFSWVGFNSVGVRFYARNRHAGKTKYSLKRMIKFGLHGVTSFSKKPLYISILIGVILGLFSLLYSLVTIIQYFVYSNFPSGWTTLVILSCLFSGLQLIGLGIIGEYIGAIFDEVKARPHYIVYEKVNFEHE